MNKLKSSPLKISRPKNNTRITSSIRSKTINTMSHGNLFPMEEWQSQRTASIPDSDSNNNQISIKTKQIIPQHIKQHISQKSKSNVTKTDKNETTLLSNKLVNVNMMTKLTTFRKKRRTKLRTRKKIVHKNNSKGENNSRPTSLHPPIKKENTKKIKHAYRITKNIVTNHKLPNPFKKIERPYNLDTVFDKIFVFNLVRDKNKKADMIRRLYNIGIGPNKYEFLKAVDGFHEKEMIKREKYLMKRNKDRKGPLLNKEKRLLKNPGAWGYTQSYINVLERVIKNKKIDRILLMDDDVIFDNNFVEKFNISLLQLPEKFELLWLGTSQRKWRYTLLPTKKSGKSYYNIGFDQVRGSFALGIDRVIFKSLLDELKQYRAPVDNAFDIIPYNPNRCYIIYPNICIADLRTGKINGERSMDLGEKKFRWKIENFDLETN